VRQVAAHRVSRRTLADQMDGRRISLTPGATLRFGSLGFIYTGPTESVARRTFARPPHPNFLTGAARREAFVRGFLDETTFGMLGPNPMQERLRLAALLLPGCQEAATSKERRVRQQLKVLLEAAAAQQAESSALHTSRLVGTSCWLGGVHGAVHCNVPPWTARALG
jgi:hypothetical protein